MIVLDKFSHKKLLYEVDEFKEDKIKLVAKNIASPIQATPNFIIWLIGDMGAGKTTLVKNVLYHLGLSKLQPVQSPTFTYMNEYTIDAKWYAHLDFYRADDTFSLDQLGIFDAHQYDGIFIEWPQYGMSNEFLVPDFAIHITYLSEHWRSLKLFQLGNH